MPNNRGILGLVISAGRCGTASLAEFIRRLNYPHVRVYHEKITQLHTLPNKYFRAYTPVLQQEQAQLEGVRQFLDEIEACGDRLTLIDTGWTLYPILPLLIERYARKVRLLHCTRHPVPMTASHALHGLYDERTAHEFRERFESYLRPWAPNTFHPEMARNWERLTLFERNLFCVGELNLLALELHDRYPSLPYLHMRVKDFSAVETRRQILEFYELPVPNPIPPMPRVNETQRFARGARSVGNDWRKILDYPWMRQLGQQLGYDMSEAYINSLAGEMKRYSRAGVVEHLAGITYRIPLVRKLWRRLIVPRLRFN